MWLEGILSKEDIVHLLHDLTPIRIRLGNDGDLLIRGASEISLVPDKGLRVICRAKLHWPVLGIDVPITLHSVTTLLLPSIRKGPGGDVLAFRLHIEQADLAGIPSRLDARITRKVNEELAKDATELVWDFTKTLSHAFTLPSSLELVDSLGLRVTWGEVRVTESALVVAVSFHTEVTRAAAPHDRDDAMEVLSEAHPRA